MRLLGLGNKMKLCVPTEELSVAPAYLKGRRAQLRYSSESFFFKQCLLFLAFMYTSIKI